MAPPKGWKRTKVKSLDSLDIEVRINEKEGDEEVQKFYCASVKWCLSAILQSPRFMHRFTYLGGTKEELVNETMLVCLRRMTYKLDGINRAFWAREIKRNLITQHSVSLTLTDMRKEGDREEIEAETTDKREEAIRKKEEGGVKNGIVLDSLVANVPDTVFEALPQWVIDRNLNPIDLLLEVIDGVSQPELASRYSLCTHSIRKFTQWTNNTFIPAIRKANHITCGLPEKIRFQR